MAQYGVTARIIDKRGTKIFNGQADGLRARTRELFDSMGIQDRVERESKTSWEFRLWVGSLCSGAVLYQEPPLTCHYRAPMGKGVFNGLAALGLPRRRTPSPDFSFAA